MRAPRFSAMHPPSSGSTATCARRRRQDPAWQSLPRAWSTRRPPSLGSSLRFLDSGNKSSPSTDYEKARFLAYHPRATVEPSDKACPSSKKWSLHDSTSDSAQPSKNQQTASRQSVSFLPSPPLPPSPPSHLPKSGSRSPCQDSASLNFSLP